MEEGKITLYSRNQNNQNDINPEQQDPIQGTNVEFQVIEQQKIEVGVIMTGAILNLQQLNQQNIPTVELNIHIINFLQLLGGYNKLKILCNKESCVSCLRSARSHQIIGINDQGEEQLIMTASQEEIKLCSSGYMLVYKSNNVIFGTLGYQINPSNDCCSCKCSCILGCCTGCCSGCCESQGCCTCCTCCSNCCNNGGCFLGGCCNEQGCCCMCEDGCCIGGFCRCCDCCCFEGGCCKAPCCKNGCCPCPEYQKILLDVRLLNTMEEALSMQGGLYVSTLYHPVDCFGTCDSHIGYKKCGERFALNKKFCPCKEVGLGIMDLKKKEEVGKAFQHKTCLGDVQSYDVELPKDALPLEKLLIISEIFMFVFLNWDEGTNNEMIITKKRKIFPGLEPNFM